MNERKHFLDNIRWVTLCFVIVYHVFYLFNSSGVISNINVTGIKACDSICVFIYPWIMCLLFAVSGVSARYQLGKKTNKEFIKDKVRRLLVPSILGMFAYGWITGYSINYYNHIFGEAENTIPGFIKYIVYSLIGSNVLWYAQCLFILSLVLVLIRKIDKKNRLDKLANKVNMPVLFILGLVVWLSSYILNMPLITVFRFGIYGLVYLLGYYVLSRDEIIDKLSKISLPLLLGTLVYGIIFTICNYGVNFGSDAFLTNIFTNIYLWLVILSAFGLFKKYFDKENKFTKYMNSNTFSFYVLHYTVELMTGFYLVEILNLTNFYLVYLLVFLSAVIILPVLSFILKKVPVINTLLLGVKKKEKSKK